MKKREIASFIDAVAEHLADIEVRVIPKSGADPDKVTTDREVEALRAGIIDGLALSASLCEGAYDGTDAHEAAVELLIVGLDAIAVKKGDEDE